MTNMRSRIRELLDDEEPRTVREVSTILDMEINSTRSILIRMWKRNELKREMSPETYKPYIYWVEKK